MTFDGELGKRIAQILHTHIGHEIEIADYQDVNLAIECIDCSEVLIDADNSSD